MAEKLKTEDLLLEARNFFNYLKKDIGRDIRSGKSVIYVSFQDLTSFSPTLSEMVLYSPKETLEILEVALEESGLVSKPRVRLKEVPESITEKIRNIRAKHLNHLVQIEGIVRLASEVRPQVVNAKFECPSCGTIISVLQIDAKFREPTRCSCGRKGQFKLISKDMVDVQRLVVEESPENLSGGEQPRRINVFLQEDLVEPKMEDKTTPGSRVNIIGILKEIAKYSQTGGQSVRYDIAIEANNIIPLEETFEELDISEEDERQIQELAADPKVFTKLAESIAPSIWGYEEIKQAIVLQLFGGVKKTKSDGNKSRGDFHILLVGDPGVAKSVNKDSKILFACNKENGYTKIEELYKKFGKSPKNLRVLTIDMKNHQHKWCEVSEILKHSPERDLIKITTEHGKEIIATKDHSFITLSENGEIVSIKGENINDKTYLPIPINFHCEKINSIDSEKFNTFKTNSKQLPEIELDEDFGFFLGIFLSEGYIMNKDNNQSKAIVISNSNKEIREKAKRFIKKVKLNVTERRNELWISSKSLSNFMAFHCYKFEKPEHKRKGNYSKLKKIPDFSYFSPKEFIHGLISGLFSGDGRFIKDKKRLKGIELLTISKELAEGTSDLLFCANFLNIVSTRKYKYKDEIRKSYLVRVPFSHLSNFLDKIKFYGREKLICPEPIYSYNDLIPYGKILYELTRKLGYNKRIGGNRVLAAEMRTVRTRNKIGRIRLKKILSLFGERAKKEKEYLILKRIAESQIIWSKIKSIEKYKKEEEVYDLVIPETNTFVANGIGVHNSQLLKFISNIAPKGRYVVGKSSSGAGLTATVVRDEFLKGWSLEAGAMVLSNHGLVCIDELEKMDPNDRSAMHEALEQQSVTISKANIQASLRAETSVLAAGNPKFGRFDPYQTVASQIDIPPTLINRFDVVFILKDIPDRVKDEMIADHVLLESKEKRVLTGIDRNLFRKYIAYSKQKIIPQLTDEAIVEIKKFYVDLRNTTQTSGDQPTRPLPISARQLDALIRMSEASAKSRLSSKVTRDDARRAIDLMKYYLMQVGYDYETKTFDIDRIATGVSTSQRGKIMLVKDALSRLEGRLGKLIPVEEVIKELEGKIDNKEIEDALDKLTISGDIFHPRKGFVQRM